MRRFTGLALMVVGIVHLGLFAVLYRDRYAAIARDGVFNTVDGDDKRETAFWTMGFGVLLLSVGSLIRSIEAGGGRVPSFPGWAMLGMGLAGGVLMPASPFWLFLPLGFAILRRPPSPKEEDAAAATPATVRPGGGPAR